MDMSIYTKSKDEINEIFDTGVFNEIVEGYILLATEKGISFNDLFDFYSAEDARNRSMEVLE